MSFPKIDCHIMDGNGRWAKAKACLERQGINKEPIQFVL